MNFVKWMLLLWFLLALVWAAFVLVGFFSTGVLTVIQLILLLGNGTLMVVNALAWRSGLYDD